MKIRIQVMKYDGDGSYYEETDYKKSPLEGAFFEEVERKQTYQDTPDRHQEPYADIIDGVPTLLYRWIEIWPKSNHPSWKKYGFNHSYDAETHTWTRYFNDIVWYIETDSYKQIVDWLVSGDAYEVDKDAKGNYILRVYA